MTIPIRGYAIPLGRIGLALLLGVVTAAIHLSVHSQAAFKEGVKQALRMEISHLQRANHQREEAVERAAQLARQHFVWEDAVRLPVETVTPYQEASGGDKHPSSRHSHREAGISLSIREEGRPTTSRRSAEEEAWYWRLAQMLKRAISPGGGKAR